MINLMRLGRLVAALLIPLSLAVMPARAAEPVKVVASFSILADLARAVGGDRVRVSAFVGPDADMHVFQPAPGAAKELLDANVVIINGLGFEGWADRLVTASGYKGPVVIATRGIKPIAASPHGHDHGKDRKGHSHGHSHGHGHAQTN